MKKVTGLGGIFFKTDDHERTRSWYRDHLGIDSEIWGSVFHWREDADPEQRGYTAWCPFKQDATKFEPSKLPFMVNYRVADLVGLLAELRTAGVEIVGEMEQHENGKFAWIMDPDGQKIELWEPVPSAEDPYLPR